MAFKLSKIDELTLGDHYHLEESDWCYYFGEYTARAGYSFSETNQLIFNFKKPLSAQGTLQWPHKLRAIDTVGHLFGELALPNDGQGAVLIPAPPSKSADDPMYDDRMFQALSKTPFDVRKLILQTRSRQSAHECDDGYRPKVADLVSMYEIDESQTAPAPQMIFICDDVLTTGATFKGMQAVLRERFPSVPIAGIFIARRAIGSDITALFEDLSD